MATCLPTLSDKDVGACAHRSPSLVRGSDGHEHDSTSTARLANHVPRVTPEERNDSNASREGSRRVIPSIRHLAMGV